MKPTRFCALLLAAIAIIGFVATSSAHGSLTRASADAVSIVGNSSDVQLFLPIVANQIQMNDPVLLAAGDTRSGCETGSFATLEILDRYPSSIPILHNGDFTNSGAANEFVNCYSQTWGKHKAQTRPVPGNHEYITPGATGYFDYFGSIATPLGTSYYSFDLGAWHIVALNSEIDISAASAQVAWLKSDLVAHPSPCTLAYWHEPRFSSGVHGNNTSVSAIWQTLYDGGAELVLNGHDHDYERFAPQDPSGGLDEAHGIQEFVIGTGGVAEGAFATIRANSRVRNSSTWGILELTLHTSSYEFRFVPTSGAPFTDAGSMICH